MQWKRFWLILAAIVCLFAAGAVTMGYSRYKSAQPAKMASAAEAAFNQGDYQQASLMARRALQLDPEHLSACKLMAEICEKMGVYDAVLWRKRAVYLSGDSTDSLIDYAKAALNSREEDIARTTLARVPDSDRQRADFQAVSGAVALNAGNYAEAERYYAAATQLDPQNQAYRFSLGKTQTSSDDFFTREAGRNLLASMTGHGEFDLPSRRTLILSYEASNEIEAALRESRKLVAVPGHTFADEVLNLRILHNADDPGFANALAAAQEKAVKNENDSALLLHWMSVDGLPAEAVEWAAKRVPAVGRIPAARQWLALAYLQLGDWPALLAVTQDGSWEPMEHVRHAYRARAMHEKGDLILARSEWKMAVASATKTEAISWLVKSSIEWNMPDEREQTLWAAAEKPQLAPEALSSLYRYYAEQKDTAKLRQVAAQLVEIDPKNKDAQNNFAMFSLLRDRDSARASETAQKLYRQHPDNPIYVSTYAFALYRGGRSDEALRVLETLSSSQLEEPTIAAYYGIILTANRLHEKAVKYLEIADDSALLPEERLLVQKARVALERKPPKPQ